MYSDRKNTRFNILNIWINGVISVCTDLQTASRNMQLVCKLDEYSYRWTEREGNVQGHSDMCVCVRVKPCVCVSADDSTGESCAQEYKWNLHIIFMMNH